MQDPSHPSTVADPDDAGLQPAALAFDLDGTLIDTAPDIRAALNRALAWQGLRAVDGAQVRGWIGDGPDRLIERALQSQQVMLTPALGGALRTAFDAATLEAPLTAGTVFAGIADLLALWHGRLPMVVVTNKPTALSRSVLAAAGLLQHFDAVLGADRHEQRKPAPDLLHEAARALGVPKARLLMIGDSQNDLLCARHAGCPALWVAWGYGDAAATTEPTRRVASVAELGRWLERHAPLAGGAAAESDQSLVAASGRSPRP